MSEDLDYNPKQHLMRCIGCGNALTPQSARAMLCTDCHARQEEQQASVDIYATGLVYCSVCASPDMEAVDVERAVNAKNPSGVTPWQVADESFRTGEDNPHLRECGQHWLLSC